MRSRAQSGITGSWIIIDLIVSMGAATATDLSQWAPRSQGSFPTDFTAIAFSPSGARALAVGSDGGAAWSHDAGATWSFVELGTAADATGVAWQDEDRVWVSGRLPSGWSAAGALLGSTDGGLTWSVVVADHPTPLTSVAFGDPIHGFAGQPADGVLATTDSGATWNPVAYPGLGLAAIEFVDPLVGHAAGTGMDLTLKRTTDGGTTWEQVYDDPTGTITAIAFPESQTGFLASPVAVSRSTNGGGSWAPRATLTEAWIDDLVFVDSNTGWVGGKRQSGNDNRGLVRVTTDGGSTWTDTGVDEPDHLAALALTTSGSLIAPGSAGTLLRSDDEGASWSDLATTPANQFLDLLMDSASAGWAVGPTGTVHRTTDAGTSWSSTGGVAAGALESIVRLGPDMLYTCGNYAFAASTDDGASWQMRYTYMDCYALRFTDNLNGLAGTRYGVWRTTDGGFSWALADGGGMGLGGVFDFAFLDALHGFAAAGIGAILETVDGGLSWTEAQEPQSYDAYLYGIALANASTGFAVGQGGRIYATGDGGATWSPQSSGVSVDLHDVVAISALEALAAGEDGTVLFTTDGGISWTPAVSGTTADLWAIEIATDGTSLIAGDWGTVLAPALPPLIFADGFEAGDLSAWSAAVP